MTVGLGCQASLSTPPPSILTRAGGSRWWLDSDYSGGVADGDVPAPVNRIAGSNAVAGITPGSGSPIFQATGWQGPRVQSAWSFAQTTQTIRITGTDSYDFANVLGANWYWWALVLPNYQFNSGPNTACFLGGWDLSTAPSFNKSSGMVAGNNTRCTLGIYPFTGSILDTPQSTVTHQAAMFVEVQRSGGNQIQFGLNGVMGAPQAYQAGVPPTVDGFSLNGWFGGATGNGIGDQRWRACGGIDHVPSAADRAALLRYLVGPTGIYTGLEFCASLGASWPITQIHSIGGQSNGVPDPPDGVLTPYSGLTSQSKLGLDGIVKPFVEPMSDFARSSTWPINHSNPDVNPGQSAFGAFASTLQGSGDITPRIFVPTARGSTSAADWLAGVGTSGYQTLYSAWQHAVQVAVQAPGAHIAPVWWNNGEADAQDATLAANYQSNLNALFNAMLAFLVSLGLPFTKASLRFVIAGLPLNSTLAFAGTVRTGQQNVAASRTDTQYVQQPNISAVGIHLTAGNQITLGNNYGGLWPGWT